MKKLLDLGSDELINEIKESFLQEEIYYYFKRNNTIKNIRNYHVLYNACKRAGIEFLYFNEINNEIHFRTPDGLHVFTNPYFGVFLEIFCDGQYACVKEFIEKDFIVLDVGANRGYSSLYFASEEKCKHVFSFEPVKGTYSILEKNISLNPVPGKKINAFNFGLGRRNETQTFKTHKEYDAICSSSISFINSFLNEQRKSELVDEEVQIRKAGEVVNEVLLSSGEFQKYQRFLKIDIEGAEYELLEELKESNTLKDFSIIVGECHMGMERILSTVKDDFSLAFLSTIPMNGLFCFVLKNNNNCQ